MRLYCARHVLLLLITLVPSYGLADDRLAQRIERKIALQSAVAGLENGLAQLARGATPSQIESLSVFIYEAPAAHESIAASRQLSRGHVENDLRRSFLELQQQSLRKANAGLRSSITLQELRAQAGDLDRRFEIATDRYLQQFFNPMFKDARSRAVTRQRESVKFNISAPTQNEVNFALSRSARWEDHYPEFAKAIRERALPEAVILLEENKDQLVGDVERLLTGVGEQVRLQFATASASAMDSRVPKQFITADDIQSHVATNVEQAIQRHTPARAVPRYEVFTPVTDLIVRESGILETERFLRFVNRTAIPLQPAVLRRAIEVEASDHYTIAESKKYFHKALYEMSVTSVVDQYADQSPNRLHASRDVRSRFEALAGNERVAAALRRAMDKALELELPKVRSTIAKEQIARHVPQLEKSSFRLSDEHVGEWFDKGGVPSTFQECTRLLGNLTFEDGTSLLAESESLIIEMVREHVTRATAALRAQLAIIRRVETSMARQLIVDVSAGVPKEQLVQAFTNHVSLEWLRQAANSPYTKLFPRANREIVKVVSQHYDAVRRQLEQQESRQRELRSESQSQAKGKSAANVPIAAERLSRQDDTAEVPLVSAGEGTGGVGTGGGRGSQGAGDNGGGSSGGEGGDRDQTSGGDDKDLLSGGQGPAPDCTIELLSQQGDRCLARLTFRNAELAPMGPAPECPFDAADVANSATKIVDALWPAIVRHLNQRAQDDRDPSKQQGSMALRIHLRVGTDAVRHRMSLVIRENFESRFLNWRRTRYEGEDTPPLLYWSDSR